MLGELHAQGFLRARIDGDTYELDDPPDLELHKKHSIEVVIDRFKVRPDLQQRLAESFETALHLAGGITRVAPMDDDAGEELIFSANFACPQCGYSIEELEPRLFSFNNPVGACPTCDGLGVDQFFDPDKVVANHDSSLAGGAIRGWDRRSSYYFQLLSGVAAHYTFDLETPWKKLTKKQQKLLLYGTGRTAVEMSYRNMRGLSVTKNQPFEGIINNLRRRYRETESSSVRDELARYVSVQPCPECHGGRLNEADRKSVV